MKTNIIIIDILERAKKCNNCKSDAELARFLGISRSTLSNWRARGSVDYNLLFSKYEQVNIDWLITGRGTMAIDNTISTQSNNNDITPSITAVKNTTTNTTPVHSIKEQFYYDMLIEKDKVISSLNQEIGMLKERNLQQQSIKISKTMDYTDPIFSRAKRSRKQAHIKYTQTQERING